MLCYVMLCYVMLLSDVDHHLNVDHCAFDVNTVGLQYCVPTLQYAKIILS